MAKMTPSFRISFNRLGAAALLVALCIVVASVLFTNHLARQMAEEEQRIIEIWAEATRQFIEADEGTDIDFVSSIIEDNTTIPVYMLDSEGKVLMTRNVKRAVDDPTLLNGPIEVWLGDEVVQYIYYDESEALRQIRMLPYVEFGVILLFVLVVIVTIYTAQRSEQNRVWAGLSKETAHQLGTPVSSLMAWQELLKERYPDDTLLPQMQGDIDRLKVIADRFSKIGSEPELHPVVVLPIVRKTIEYMQTRISKRVEIRCEWDSEYDQKMCMLCEPLFQWVIENLVKNAADAMNGAGQITVTAGVEEGSVWVDVKDTGCGISSGMYKRIFLPGYSTKQRGWGLGLSLCKRIINGYHKGRIFVKQSQVGVGTTFRITLPVTN